MGDLSKREKCQCLLGQIAFLLDYPRIRVIKKHTMYVGLDVHKDSISIALAEDGRDGEVHHYGKIGGDLSVLDRAIAKFEKKRELHFVYEAGPTGYVIYRHLNNKGYDCCVVAPSETPRKQR